ncbi:MAG: hypothetical protein PHH26_02390 [Candidatus Thermoplasmatota archaeon]|nr:hypothetical protein [Candidatus Thermoplasmatota archaeon]
MRAGLHTIILVISVLVVLPIFAPPTFMAALSGNGNCGSCHGGFNPFKFSFNGPKEASVGEEFDFVLGAKNTWTHQVSNLSVVVSLSGSPGLSFACAKGPLLENVSDSVGLLSLKKEKTIIIDQNASRLTVVLEGKPGVHTLNNIDLAVSAPSGRIWNSTGLGASESVTLEQADIAAGGYGEWKATVSWTYGDPDVAYKLAINAECFSELRERFALIGSLAPGEQKTVSWRLQCIEKSMNNVTATGRCHVHYDHTDATITDDADYDRTGRMQIVVSDSYVNGSGQDSKAENAPAWLVAQSWLAGQILGFAALGLIAASVITGGFPNNKAKIRLNKKFGSGVRRVRIHCWVSIAVIVLSVLHGIILLLGFYHGRLTGLTLGGISLAAMLGLGLVGYLHVPVSKKIGHGRWRAVHISLAATALLFGLLHTFIDGTTLPRLLGY